MASSYGVTVEITTPPEAVWAILTARDDWDTWNPTQPSFSGDLVPGARIRIAVRLGAWIWRGPASLMSGGTPSRCRRRQRAT